MYIRAFHFSHMAMNAKKLEREEETDSFVHTPNLNDILYFSLGLDPASLATGVFGSNSGYGNNNATLQAAAAAAAALSSNPSLAGATGLSTNQMLAQLLNPGLPLANLAPVSANPLSMPTNTAGGLYQTANSGGTYAQVQNAAASLNAGASNSSLVNVMRPNFTNLKKARSEAAPY